MAELPSADQGSAFGFLFAILGAARRSFRGNFAGRLTVVVLASAIAGATAGLLPAMIGIALNVVLERPEARSAGIAGVIAHLTAGAPAAVVIAAAMVATLVTVGVSVLSSKLGSQLAGEVTAALRIEMLRATLGASPRDVDAAGKIIAGSKGGPPPPPGIKVPEVRGTEVVKVAIAREAALAADFSIAVLTGLPQALVTLLVLAFELIADGTWLVLAGGAGLFVISRFAADRASRRVAREMQAMQQADTAIFGSLGETLAATEDLRLLGARGQALREFAEAAYRVADARTRFTGALAVSGQIKSVFSAMSPLLILLALKISSRSHDPGDVAKLLLFAPLLMARFEALDALRSGLIERGPVLRAAARLLHLPESPARPEHPASAHDLASGAIVFDAVRFTPSGGSRAVIDGLSLEVPEGAIVGICGPSGCGKSTLLRLLLRLDEPDGGAIRVGGVGLDRLSADELPKIFAVLGQASRLLERSIGKNLAMGLDSAPADERMRATLRRVKLDELAGGAAALAPGGRGLDTEFRAIPPSFSGGEQRRLLLARMLVRDARIFVLDEPESGLPSATAEEILRAVAELAGGRTCLVVTHAPHLLASTFNVVMAEGKIAAIGTHDHLVATSDIYRALLAEGLRGPGKPAPGAPAMAGPPGRPAGLPT